jgi:hypothetical protein
VEGEQLLQIVLRQGKQYADQQRDRAQPGNG